MGRLSLDETETGSLAGDTRDAPGSVTPLGGDREAVSLAPGHCLGRYTIVARIGAGGMGEVFAAHDPQLDRVVALKVLRADTAGEGPEANARFQREAQAMARLNHPNVVSVYDAGAVDGQVFIAMELVEGPTLASWLAAGRRSWREVVDLFVQAGRGLIAAHAAGIVHRDFKPSNVILGDRVRVADFGLARSALAPEAPAAADASVLLGVGVTHTGRLVGTPAYMSPEQRAGAPLTAATDQYSFCVALFEGLFGGLPPTARRSRPVPRWLRAVVERGMEERPDRRFPSMAELVAALARGPRRQRRLAIAGAGLVAVAAGALLLVPRASPPAPDWRPVVIGHEPVDSPIVQVAVSRDGAIIAYATKDDVMVEPRAGGERVHVPVPTELGQLDSIKLSQRGTEVLAAFLLRDGSRAIWALAVAGITLTLLAPGLPRWVGTALYIGMGWVAVLALPAFVAVLPWIAVAVLLLGGALYTVGGIVYARRRPDPFPHVLGFHEVFHLLVIAGGAAFALMIWLWVLPFPHV